MYESFYRFREKPFSILPDPGFLFFSAKHRMAFDMLEYGLVNQAGFNVITGEIGTGKTTLIRHLLDQMGADVTVGLISNTHRAFGELMQWVLFAFRLDYKGRDSVAQYEMFLEFLVRQYSEGRRTVLIVDEAQNMTPDVLEELRMLTNLNADKDHLLHVILVGQAGLRDTLRRPELEQFAQRIAVNYHLEPLNEQETHAYIAHRVRLAGNTEDEVFTVDACAAVYDHSNGVPRLINLICDTALVYGFAEQRAQIDGTLVEEVVRDKLSGGIFPRQEKKSAA